MWLAFISRPADMLLILVEIYMQINILSTIRERSKYKFSSIRCMFLTFLNPFIDSKARNKATQTPYVYKFFIYQIKMKKLEYFDV